MLSRHVLDAIANSVRGRNLVRGGFDISTPWYHGSTHDVPAFDVERGNVENFFGRYPHFSSDSYDADANYAGIGPDLKSRIEDLAERIDSTTNTSYEAAKIAARKRLVGAAPDGVMYPVFLRMKRPAVIGGPNEPWIDFGPTYDKDGEFVDDSRALYDLDRALSRVQSRYDDVDKPRIMEELADLTYDSTRTGELFRALKKSEGLAYATDESGRLAQGQAIADVFQDLGFDGMILRNADREFPNMRIPPNTSHAAVFEPWQVRSVFARGNPRKRKSGDLTAGIVGGAAMMEAIRRYLNESEDRA